VGHHRRHDHRGTPRGRRIPPRRPRLQVKELTGGLPTLLIREGVVADELLALLAEDPQISILVLATASGSKGPGPLVSALTAASPGR
jgi:hypothetical protein